jgi:hypothetical protein
MKFALSILIAILLLPSCSSDESRLREAQRIGAIDIDPRSSFGAIRVLTPIPPDIEYSTGEYAIENLVQAKWGEGFPSRAILELDFYAPTNEIADASVPINVTVRPPFQGTLLGVQIGETADSALSKVRGHYARAWISETGRPRHRTLPGDTSEGWVIHLDDDHLLMYSKEHGIRRGKLVDPPEYSESLRYDTISYRIKPKAQ